MIYNWQQEDWPHFTYSLKGIEEELYEFTERSGRISGLLEGLGEKDRVETIVELMVEEAIKTSEIEGEYINKKEVASSIRKQMGLHHKIENVKDKRAEGIGELMMEVRDHYKEPLSEEMLLQWHRILMKGHTGIQKGKWRSHQEPMQIVSGALGKERIHFEAPPSRKLPREMKQFISWFNGQKDLKPAVHAAIAHLYFESIHPFEDGNGRIGRAISEKALSMGLGRPVVLSLSQAIETDRKAYYHSLEKAQRSKEITPWIEYFVRTIIEAQIYAESLVDFTLKKSKYFRYFHSRMNDRQLKVIRRMFDEGPAGFEGGMRARKYKSITAVSKATATRDLQDLLEKKAVISRGGGRSTRYDLNLELYGIKDDLL